MTDAKAHLHESTVWADENEADRAHWDSVLDEVLDELLDKGDA